MEAYSEDLCDSPLVGWGYAHVPRFRDLVNYYAPQLPNTAKINDAFPHDPSRDVVMMIKGVETELNTSCWKDEIRVFGRTAAGMSVLVRIQDYQRHVYLLAHDQRDYAHLFQQFQKPGATGAGWIYGVTNVEKIVSQHTGGYQADVKSVFLRVTLAAQFQVKKLNAMFEAGTISHSDGSVVTLVEGNVTLANCFLESRGIADQQWVVIQTPHCLRHIDPDWVGMHPKPKPNHAYSVIGTTDAEFVCSFQQIGPPPVDMDAVPYAPQTEAYFDLECEGTMKSKPNPQNMKFPIISIATVVACTAIIDVHGPHLLDIPKAAEQKDEHSDDEDDGDDDLATMETDDMAVEVKDDMVIDAQEPDTQWDGVFRGLQKVQFMLGDCLALKGQHADSYVCCYQDEATMLQDYVQWLTDDVDRDWLGGYNSVGFDLRAILSRASKLGLTLDFGRAKRSNCMQVWPKHIPPRFDVDYCHVAGTVQWDAMFAAFKGPQKFSQYKLNLVAQGYLGVQKADLSYDKMWELHKTNADGRRIVAQYNMQDSMLCLLLAQAWKSVTSLIEQARVTYTTINDLLFAGSLQQSLNQFFRQAHADHYLCVPLPVAFAKGTAVPRLQLPPGHDTLEAEELAILRGAGELPTWPLDEETKEVSETTHDVGGAEVMDTNGAAAAAVPAKKTFFSLLKPCTSAIAKAGIKKPKVAAKQKPKAGVNNDPKQPNADSMLKRKFPSKTDNVTNKETSDDDECMPDDGDDEEEPKAKRSKIVRANKKKKGYQGAMVLDPKKGFYGEGIITLDFSSLYPSLIMSENFCIVTIVTSQTILDRGLALGHKFARHGQYIYCLSVKGMLVKLEYFLVGQRQAVKKLMAAAKKAGDKALEERLNHKQLNIKISCNAVYGVCGAEFGKELEAKCIAQSITRGGRLALWKTIAAVMTRYQGDMTVCTLPTEVIYGDTDSVMVRLAHLTTPELLADPIARIRRAFELGAQMSDDITRLFKPPMKLEFEKFSAPFSITAKKRYVAKVYADDPDKPPKVKCSGLDMKRRDTIPFVARVCEEILKLVMNNQTTKAVKFAKEQARLLAEGKVERDDLVMTASLGSNYAEGAQEAHVQVAQKRAQRDPGDAPSPGDRIAMLMVTAGETAKALNKPAKLVTRNEQAEDPAWVARHNLQLDLVYYLETHFIRPVTELLVFLVPQPDKLFADDLRLANQIQNHQTSITSLFVRKV